MIRSRHRVSMIVVALALGGLSAVGCAYQEPVPPPAPAPRALTITAQKKQTKAQQDADSAACQSQASAQATNSHEWTLIFTSCMSGRGYMVQ